MKKLLLAFILTLWAAPSYAAPDCAVTPLLCRCVSVVFIKGGELETVTVKWGQVKRLANRMMNRAAARKKKVAAVHFFYDQFGSQGGPTSENMEGQDMALSFIEGTTSEPRDMLYWPVYSADPSASQDQSFRDWFIAALDDTEDVTLVFEEETGRTSSLVLSGTDVVLLEGTSNTQLALDGFNLAATIQADIEANGC